MYSRTCFNDFFPPPTYSSFLNFKLHIQIISNDRIRNFDVDTKELINCVPGIIFGELNITKEVISFLRQKCLALLIRSKDHSDVCTRYAGHAGGAGGIRQQEAQKYNLLLLAKWPIVVLKKINHEKIGIR